MKSPRRRLVVHRFLGRKVGENVWRRAEQFLLGTASPTTAVLAALRPPFWFHDNESSDHPAHFEAGSVLEVNLPRGGAGVWRSTVVDAMPAGTYELKFKAKVTGDQPIRLKVAIEPNERLQVAPLSATEAMLAATGSDATVTISWTSDGIRSFRVCLEARADSGSARLLISAIKATRVWPTVTGSPRYYEPSSAGQPDQ
jgi:hypothetical protein